MVRYFDSPDTALDEEFDVPFFSLRYQGNMNSFIDWSVFYFGAYAKDELRLLERILSRIDGPVFIDVGANVGQHSLFAARFAAKVVSVEPFPRVASRIRQKVEANNLTGTLVVCEIAFGDENGTAVFHQPTGSNHGTGTLTARRPTSGVDINVSIRCGDDVLDEMGIDRVDLIKIDVEQFESFVLLGLKATLTRHRPLVFFEWSQARATVFRTAGLESLFPEGYSFYRFESPRPFLGVFNLPGFNLSLARGERRGEFHKECNYLAVPKERVTFVNEICR